MGKRTKTVQSNLFWAYSLVIIIVLAMFVSFFYLWVSNLLKDRAFQSIDNLSDSISDKLDIEIQKLDYIFMNAPYSKAVKERFMAFINKSGKIANTPYDYSTVFKGIDGLMHKSTDQAHIYVYNGSGSLIYPYKETISKKDSYYFKLRNSKASRTFSKTAYNPYSNEKELLCFKYSGYTGWTTVVAIPERKLFFPVFDFTRTLVLVTVIILFLVMLFSYFTAKKITVPIARLNRAIKSLDLESPVASAPAELTSDLNELESLNQAFHKMNIKLKNSHDELMFSQQHEMQARMLALQSQMNPHFLYNTLSTISVMAEESMNEQIVDMCSNTSDMLRYISSNQSPLVELRNELEYTEKYLSCMKSRYGSKLSYSIEIDEEMLDIKIPKLVIQPLVENALKYGTNQEPPWNIRIFGHKANTYWQVSVQDNGAGFDTEKLNIIRNKTEEINKNGLLPSLEIEGMGLLNIYMRLKLTYKNQMIFEIGDFIAGGAIITIGGSI
ncbi:MAG TPA: sensor histidine kinase [Clostridia bacterium]|nr:sensor histidine kinase [Clostridia bacterium]